jgi:pimeloyl-ACP methyl ester carboxylesterase
VERQNAAAWIAPAVSGRCACNRFGVAARLALSKWLQSAASFAKPPYRPVRVAHRVRCPLLVCIGEEDHVVPRRAAERSAEREPRGECGVYPIDHFGGFVGEDFERVDD